MIEHKKAAAMREDAIRAVHSAIASLDVSAITTAAMSRNKADGTFAGEMDTLLRLCVIKFDAAKLVAEAEAEMG
jgi:hypothetical protein